MMSNVMRYAVIETALCIGGNILAGEVSMIFSTDYDAALSREAEQSKQNEILRGLINEGLARETALRNQLEITNADLTWSENDSRYQAKELAALREELKGYQQGARIEAEAAKEIGETP